MHRSCHGQTIPGRSYVLLRAFFLPRALTFSHPMHSSGLHNFAHPRTDAVVITVVTNAENDKILLGRNVSLTKNSNILFQK